MLETPKRFLVRTLGCKANLADSLEIARGLSAKGWIEGDGAADLCVINSCSVTDEADRQSRKLASRLKRENPGARVVVTGCSAEIDPERLAQSAGIDYVVGNRDKHRLVELVLESFSRDKPAILGEAQGYDEITSRHASDRVWPKEWETEAALSHHHTRGFLKVQEGCNAFCTYCIIPYGRGPSRSIGPTQVLERVSKACDRGIREIVLTGTNLGDYGEGVDSFEGLIERILSETRLERLRLSSLDPVEITPGILRLMESEKRLCAHFHVSLQSPVDSVLRLMKRKYGWREASRCLEAIAALKRPAFVGMDLITGFPGETDEDFELSIDRLKSVPWSRLHVFPYSEREGTPATRLKGAVGQALRVQRAKRLRELSLERMQAHYERCFSDGSLSRVLLERPVAGYMSGYSPEYLKVRVPADEGLRNQVVDVILKQAIVDRASGEVFYDALIKPKPDRGLVVGVDHLS